MSRANWTDTHRRAGFYRRLGDQAVGEPLVAAGMLHRRMAERLSEGVP